MTTRAFPTAPEPQPLFADIRQLISAARQRVVGVGNAELTLLYWHIGQRVRTQLLQGQCAKYGNQLVADLARQLTVKFGPGWSEQQLRHCMRLAEVFADAQILSTGQRELFWAHLKVLICDLLQRVFYVDLCKLECCSVHQLQERIHSMLFEHTAISCKPEATIAQDLEHPAATPRDTASQTAPIHRAGAQQACRGGGLMLTIQYSALRRAFTAFKIWIHPHTQ